ISGLYHAALTPAAYASRTMLPPSLQDSLPAGWLAFAGRASTLWIAAKGFRSSILLFWTWPGAREVSFLNLPLCSHHSITSLASSVGGRDQGSSQATDQECAARWPEPARMRPCRQRHRLHAQVPCLA